MQEAKNRNARTEWLTFVTMTLKVKTEDIYVFTSKIVSYIEKL